MRLSGYAEATAANEWRPVVEESPGRRLSAPSQGLCGVTDIGRCRSKNEDGFFLSIDGRLWIVADGMGGHAAGDVASTMTIQAIADSMDAVRPIAARAGTDAGHLLMGAFANAQEWVSCRSRSDDECRGMGSTAIAAIVRGEELHVCHVGDARGYHLSEGQFRRLTNDHSLVWDLVMSGLLTPEQARCHPHRGRIKQAIGMVSGVQPEVTSLMLKPADRVLLCSDGLWEALTEKEIGRIVGADGSMMELASLLVQKADMASGQDNITAVLYEHSSGTPS